MIDVQQIALALRSCTRQSLVIVDEFGKGTESTGTKICYGLTLTQMALDYSVQC
jgi:DNA mismatch repair ATPase MutS